MNKWLFFLGASMLLFASCKKCYECHQYCAYCQSKANAALVYKVCASKSGTDKWVDSVYYSFPDSLYTCVKLKEDRDVCDREGQIVDAVNYFQKQEYYCYPK